METKKLTRSTTDRKIAGICGGLGEYLNVDPLVFRIIFLFLLLCGGGGFIIYLIMWILIPEKKSPVQAEMQNGNEIEYDIIEDDTNYSPDNKKKMKKHNKGIFWGLLFVALGFLWLGRSFGFFDFSWCNVLKLWPLLIVWFGVLLLPIGHVLKNICNFILLAVAIFLLFWLPVRSCHHHFWKGYDDAHKYIIKKEITTSDCSIEIDTDDLDIDADTETIVITAHGDSIVIDQKARNKEEKVIIKKIRN